MGDEGKCGSQGIWLGSVEVKEDGWQINGSVAVKEDSWAVWKSRRMVGR